MSYKDRFFVDNFYFVLIVLMFGRKKIVTYFLLTDFAQC